MSNNYEMTRKEKSILRHCIIIAKQSCHRCKHGVAVYKGNHISLGYNIIKNDPEIGHKFSMGHAETRALNNLKDPKGYSCISIRLDPFDELALSMPCKACQKEMKKAGIKKCIYSDNRSTTGFSVMEL